MPPPNVTNRVPLVARAPLAQRTPLRQQQAPYGSVNTAAGARAVPPRTLRMQGPVQAREQFSAHADLPPHISRALDQLQEYVRAAVAPIKALPFANGVLIENVALAQGGNSGAAPFTVLQHGLGRPFRGYDIKAVRLGQLTGHAVVPNPNPQALPVAPLDSVQMQLWVQWVPFIGGQIPTADVWVYA